MLPFSMLFKMVLTFDSVNEFPQCSLITQLFHVMMFIMLCKVVLTFESVAKI